jgi:hypothetical protein
MKSVYSAVWTGNLNVAVCASSAKGLIREKLYDKNIWGYDYGNLD